MSDFVLARLKEVLSLWWRSTVVLISLVASLVAIASGIMGLTRAQTANPVKVAISIVKQPFQMPGDVSDLVDKANRALDRYLEENQSADP